MQIHHKISIFKKTLHMRYTLIILCLLPLFNFSQTNTEVFLFDLETKNAKLEINNPKNLSNNEGYDNQPSFLNERYIIFASTRNEQTDIAKYDLRYDSKSWINFSEGGEYSPLKIPNKNEVSAVRLDKDGKQRLYSYNLSNGESKELIPNLVVAYYTWFSEDIIVSAVIENESLNLYVSNLKKKTNTKLADNVGRSFHRIPSSNLISFISKENDNEWQIKSLNPISGSINLLANTMKGVEDICWQNDRTLLSGEESVLYKLTLRRDNNWKKVIDLAPQGITAITRLAVNETSDKLLVAGDVALVTSEKSTTSNTAVSNSPDSENAEQAAQFSAIVQQQIDAYNARDIDAFMATYAANIKLYDYPNTLRTDGQIKMRDTYTDWFAMAKDLKAVIKNRIVIGNKVIDEEQVTVNGQIINAVAIYEIEKGKIAKVTFIQ